MTDDGTQFPVNDITAKGFDRREGNYGLWEATNDSVLWVANKTFKRGGPLTLESEDDGTLKVFYKIES